MMSDEDILFVVKIFVQLDTAIALFYYANVLTEYITMIWSEKELAYMPLAGEKVIISQVMTKLGMPENEDIFLPQNFSLLWGILGVVGLVNTTADVRAKIWLALKDGGALDAFKLGILADFTAQMSEHLDDYRLKAWEKLDNYDASIKFCRLILDDLIFSNPDLCADIFALGYRPWDMLEKFDKQELSFSLKVYLEQILQYLPDDGLEKAKYFLFHQRFLKRLVFLIRYTRRDLTEGERKYFCFYFQDLLSSGFDRHDLGITDHFWAKLMLQKNVEMLSEIECTALRSYNRDIMDFIFPFEENDGFYEECAAVSIYGEEKRFSALYERCLYLAKKTTEPRGVVFAKALLNIGEVGLAIRILQTLAKYGQATMLVCYFDVLLAAIKGEENVLLQILKANLFAVRNNSVRFINAAYKEFITRHYLLAVQGFINNGNFVQAASLLQEMVMQQWFADSEELKSDFIVAANKILLQGKQFHSGLISAANKLNLKEFYNGDICFVDFNKDDLSHTKVEDSIKDVVAEKTEEIVEKTNIAEKQISSAEKDLSSKVGNAQDVGAVSHDTINDKNDNKSNVLEIDSKEVDKHFEQIKQTVDAVIQEQVALPENVSEKNTSESLDVEQISPSKIDIGQAKNDESKKTDDDSKINLNNILNIDSKEIDKYFEQIKNLTDDAFKKVSQKAAQITEGIREKNTFSKIKQLASKIKFPTKK